MYLSVYLDKNSLPAVDFIVFHVSDKSIFYDSHSQGEEKCRFGCTVISSEVKKKTAVTVRKTDGLKRIWLLYLALKVYQLQHIHRCGLTFN